MQLVCKEAKKSYAKSAALYSSSVLASSTMENKMLGKCISYRAFPMAALLILCVFLTGCGEDKEDGKKMNIYGKSGQLISDAIRLGAEEQVFELNPPIKVTNKVQYVSLSVPEANLWRSGTEAGTLISSEEIIVSISISAQSESNKNYTFNSVSYGKDLLFSHLPENPDSDRTGIPIDEVLVSITIKSVPTLDVRSIGWLDITNK